LQKPEEAITAFDKAIEINPQDSIALKYKRALSNTEQPAYQDSMVDNIYGRLAHCR
jgi:tetratricopeptide (TPR) repeat protein